MKLTLWFPATIKPVRVGVYETNSGFGHTGFAHWDGRQWSPEKSTVARATKVKAKRANFQSKTWRGIAK